MEYYRPYKQEAKATNLVMRKLSVRLFRSRKHTETDICPSHTVYSRVLANRDSLIEEISDNHLFII
jgi:hypothetical protein